MTDTLTMRDATPADAASIARLLGQLGYPTTAEDVPARLARIAGSGNRVGLKLAEREGRVVGLATVHILTVINRPADVAQLSALVVDEDERGTGVGRALVAEVERFARERGCERLSVTTHEDRSGAHAFYPSVGLEHTGRRYGKSLR